MDKDASEIRREIEQTRARMGDTVEALSYKADVPARVKDAVHDRVETVRGTIGDVVTNVKDTVARATGRVGEASDTVTSSVHTVTDKVPSPGEMGSLARRGVGFAAENPLGLALGALALGFLAGLAAPVTDLEREKIGSLGEGLMDKAQSIGGDVLEHGKQVLAETAQSALQTAQQSVQEHGMQVLDEAKGGSTHAGGADVA